MTARRSVTMFWKSAIAAASFAAMLVAPRAAVAQPQIVGYLSNLDVPNDVKDANGNPRETEGFEIQIEGVAARGTFSATNLPAGLEIEKEQGIIHGRLKKGSAGQSSVTVAFTQGGATATQVFSWVVVR